MSYDPSIMVLRNHVRTQKHISNTTMPMAIKLRLVTYNEDLTCIKSHDPSITWSRGKLNTLFPDLHYTNGRET